MPQRLPAQNQQDPTWGRSIGADYDTNQAAINAFMKSLTQIFDSVNGILGDSYYTQKDIDELLKNKADLDDIYIVSGRSVNPRGGWIAGVEYEFLDLVTYNGNLYIARVEKVPVGIYPTNTDYWMLAAEITVRDWTEITNKPNTFPPSNHNHDDRYYTESEVDEKLNQKINASLVYNKNEVDELLDRKANLNSPTFAGTPRAVTPPSSDNTNRIATTAFVQSGLSSKADVNHTHDDRYYTETEIDTKFADYLYSMGLIFYENEFFIDPELA